MHPSAHTGFCRIFAIGMFQTSSKCYDRAVLLWSRPLATTLPKGRVLGLQGSVAKILQNPVLLTYRVLQVGCQIQNANVKRRTVVTMHTMRVWFYNNGGLASFVCIVTTTCILQFYNHASCKTLYCRLLRHH